MESDHKEVLPQGWTLNREAITATQEFWRGHDVELSEEEAREAIHNMAAFVSLLDSWSHPADDAEHRSGGENT